MGLLTLYPNQVALPKNTFRFTKTMNSDFQNWFELKTEATTRLITDAKTLQATEAHGKVIGLTATFQRLQRQAPSFTYAMNIFDLYCAATRSWLDDTRSLRLLGLAATQCSTPGLPSWSFDCDQPARRFHGLYATRL